MLSVDLLVFSHFEYKSSFFFIRQLVLFCQHGVTMHGPIWHYLFEVGHFHYMMDEHISEYNSFETHFYLFSIAYWGIPTSPKASDLP